MLRARPLPIRAIGAAIAMLAVVAPAPRAGAAPTTACSAKSGVTVIVDFTHFGRNIERGCARGHPATALAALRAAGFETAGTSQYGDAFLCRLDGLPSSAHEPCTNTPPANSSWSFYWARPTATDWTYSTAGVLSFRPAAGTIIAFAFGNYAQPGIHPTAVNAGPTTTTIITPAPATTVAAPPASAPSLAPTSTVTPVPSARPVTPTEPTVPASTLAPVSTGVSRPTTPIPPITNRTIVSHDNSGSPLAAVLALVLVAILAGAGALTIRARRRRAA